MSEISKISENSITYYMDDPLVVVKDDLNILLMLKSLELFAQIWYLQQIQD
jgi:hypothetical protein